jgi:hypothetical protein
MILPRPWRRALEILVVSLVALVPPRTSGQAQGMARALARFARDEGPASGAGRALLERRS